MFVRIDVRVSNAEKLARHGSEPRFIYLGVPRGSKPRFSGG